MDHPGRHRHPPRRASGMPDAPPLPAWSASMCASASRVVYPAALCKLRLVQRDAAVSRGLGARWSVGGARRRLDLPEWDLLRQGEHVTWPRATGVPASQGRSGGKPRAGTCKPSSAERKHPCLLWVGAWIGARCAVSDRRGARSTARPWCLEVLIATWDTCQCVSCSRDRVKRELRRQLELGRVHAEVRRACGCERLASRAGLAAGTRPVCLTGRILCCPEDRMCAACPATQDNCAQSASCHCAGHAGAACGGARARKSRKLLPTTTGTGILWISCIKRRCGGLRP